MLQTSINTAIDGSATNLSVAAGLPESGPVGSYLLLVQNVGAHTAFVGPANLSGSSYRLAPGKDLRLRLVGEHFYAATAADQSTNLVVLIVLN